jgi:hypothetical protein
MSRLTALTVLVLVTACQAPAPTPEPPLHVASPTAAQGEQGCRLRLNSGMLVADQDVGLAVQMDRRITVVVWPHGWAAVEQDGIRILLNERGDPIARVGDQIAFGGAEGTAGRIRACGEIRRIP